MLTAPQGVADLRVGLLRTPLPPEETLGQDPLRILRCIRFAARFGFRVDAQLAAAMKDAALQVPPSSLPCLLFSSVLVTLWLPNRADDDDVIDHAQKELGSTIGRQRIAAEVTKMLSGASFVAGSSGLICANLDLSRLDRELES
jgi:hypothetical protein